MISTDLTGHGCAGYTPDYAAPEQRLGGSISTATDVYALGVMALELLVGSKRADLRSQPASQTVLQSADNIDKSLALTQRSLARYLRGDLDNVLRQCLEEEPQRRYQGAQALADDLRRFPAEQPVSAHPPSRWYLARKIRAASPRRGDPDARSSAWPRWPAWRWHCGWAARHASRRNGPSRQLRRPAARGRTRSQRCAGVRGSARFLDRHLRRCGSRPPQMPGNPA
ncbi:MAG: hypothetical protein IPO66_23205 [Rhodanobacteraceae bacterium]|nr:hypothetical protein [Rhodanobacteraceae bacterium]